MELVVTRKTCSATCTIGRMSIDGVDTCWTLEDVVRPNGEKVYGETAIPAGRYRVIVNRSNRFQCDMPLVCDVPNFKGIRIHPGNTAANTDGCILVGMDRNRDSVLQSRIAYNIVWPKIRDAFKRGEAIWLTVKDI